MGEPTVHKYGLEKLFYDYGGSKTNLSATHQMHYLFAGVDIELWGHEHIYERHWPLYDYKVTAYTLVQG